jgi:hypothetical protein
VAHWEHLEAHPERQGVRQVRLQECLVRPEECPVRLEESLVCPEVNQEYPVRWEMLRRRSEHPLPLARPALP